ncbi:YccF domain-containing protein [Conchiformibius kuhniae]|uniref:Inner membrane protein YccF n=1 Tax=Conchiformibius kuhniae TaxID=211502 RepID=A0A8T9MRH9_9NEIS|nr:YccF domain-containing protein [Conchiformibius kuhniae]
MFRTLLNILWLICGGLVSALGWWLAGLLMAVSIIGLPWAKACFVIGQFSLWPFGRDAVPRKLVTGQDDIGTGTAGLLGNILWFVVAGVWLAIAHLTAALACFVTVIGIPFGLQYWKLAMLAIAPIGKTVIPVR